MSKNISRRRFIKGVGGAAAGAYTGGLGSAREANADSTAVEWDPDRPQIISSKPLVIQPLLRHEIETRKPHTSWRNWGDVHTEADGLREVRRISKELGRLSQKADFPLEILPVARVTTDAQAANVRDASPADVMILYAAGARSLDPCITSKRSTIIFVRHRSGPVYDWYENVSNRFLRVPGRNFEYDQFRNFEGVGVDDIVVDDYDEVLTHYESDYGAAPKVSMPIGRQVTIVNPDCAQVRWLGFTGTVESNPAYSICRSQQDIRIEIGKLIGISMGVLTPTKSKSCSPRWLSLSRMQRSAGVEDEAK